MLGIPDVWVLLAFLFSLASSLLCIFWGIYRWNEKDAEDEPISELRNWAVEDVKVTEKL